METPHRWKADLLDYDNLIGATDASCCVCLSQRSMLMILAISEQYHWKTRYFTDSGVTIDTDIIDQWASKLEGQIVAGLDNCCGGSALTRINADGELEVSFDGGETWSPAPDLDPRNTSTIFPPLPSSISNTACAGAQNARAQLESFVDQLADILDAGGAFTAIVGLAIAAVAVFLSAGALAPLVVSLMGGLVTVGATSLRAAFDSDVFDEFECCVLETIGSDARYTDISGLLDCINSHMTGLAQTTTYSLIQIMGQIGVTNWARTGSSSGEGCSCDDCEAWVEGVGFVNGIDTTVEPIVPGIPNVAVSGGSYSLANHWIFTGGCSGIDGGPITVTFDHPVCVQRVGITFVTGDGGVSKAIMQWGSYTSPASASDEGQSSPTGIITDTVTVTNDGAGTDCIGVQRITIIYLEV